MRFVTLEFTNGKILSFDIDKLEQENKIINKFKKGEILDMTMRNDNRYIIDLSHVSCITVGDEKQ